MSETVSEVLSEVPELEAPVSAPGVGVQLKAAREAKRLQLADVAQTLKLGARQVEALESGDWQGLPGQTFIRGFVRNYARLVNLDPAPLMQQLDTVLQRPVNSLALPESKPTTVYSSDFGASGRDRLVILSGVVMVGLALLVYLLLPNDLSELRSSAQSLIDSLARKESAEVAVPATPATAPADPVFPPGSTPQQVMTPQALTPAETVPPAAAAVPALASADPVVPAAALPASNAAPLRFVVAKESWIEVRDRDDKVVFSQRSPNASEQSVNAPGPLSLVIGYAPGVKIYWRGQSVDLAPHTRGDVARLVLE